MITPSVIRPTVAKGFAIRQMGLGTDSYDLTETYPPDTGMWQSKVLDFGSPKFQPNPTYIFDRSRYNNHGTITGATWTRLPSGLWGLSFDADDYVVTPSFALAAPYLCFSVWANTTLHATKHAFILGDAAQSATIGYIIFYRSSNTDDLNWEYADGTNPITVTSGGFFTGFDGKNVQIGFIADFTAKTVKFIRNGAQVGATTNMGGVPVFPSTNRVKYLGSYNNAPNLANRILYLPKLNSSLLAVSNMTKDYNQGRHLFGV